jgi:hypothetical protein
VVTRAGIDRDRPRAEIRIQALPPEVEVEPMPLHDAEQDLSDDIRLAAPEERLKDGRMLDWLIYPGVSPRGRPLAQWHLPVRSIRDLP